MCVVTLRLALNEAEKQLFEKLDNPKASHVSVVTLQHKMEAALVEFMDALWQESEDELDKIL